MTTKNVVADDVLGRTTRKVLDLFRRVREGTLDPEGVDKDLQRILETQTAAQRLRGKLTPPKAQLDDLVYPPLVHRTRKFGLEPSPEDTMGLATSLPRLLPSDPLTVVTLTWTFDTLASTLKAKVDILAEVLGSRYKADPVLFEEEAVRLTPLLDGEPTAFPARTFSWSIDDLGANKGKAPRDCQGQRLSGIEILDVAIQHALLFRAQDGDEVPYWYLGGIQVDADGDGSFGYTPFLAWSRSIGDFVLQVKPADSADWEWSVPIKEL